MKYRINFVGTCCDTGRYETSYEFDSLADAELFRWEWEQQIERDGIGFSDGWEDMSHPFLVDCGGPASCEDDCYAGSIRPHGWRVTP